jgi:putative DNA primase/helicase
MLALEELVADTGTRLVIVDPLTAHLSSALNSWSDHSVRRALAPLHRLAEATGSAIVVILHLNKGMSGDAMRRIGGSVAFRNAARSVLILARDPGDLEGNGRVLVHDKCNVGPQAPSLVYALEPILISAVDGDPEVETSRLRLIGESEHTSGDVLERRGDDEHVTAIDEATAFLLEELGSEEVAAKTVISTAKQIGIAEKTLRRAANELRVKKAKTGFDGSWVWSLPDRKVGHLRRDGHLGHLRGAMRDAGSLDVPFEPEGGHNNDGHLRADRIPVPGDVDFADWIDDKLQNGRVTEAEWLERRKQHAGVAT